MSFVVGLLSLWSSLDFSSLSAPLLRRFYSASDLQIFLRLQIFRCSDSDSAGDELEPVHPVEPRDDPVEGAEDGSGVQDAGVVDGSLSAAPVPPSDAPRLEEAPGSDRRSDDDKVSPQSHFLSPVPVLRFLSPSDVVLAAGHANPGGPQGSLKTPRYPKLHLVRRGGSL